MTDEIAPLGASEYLCYRLLVELEASKSSQISRSKFHRLSCITDRYLDSELGVDIGFPRYWYLYGEVVDEQSLDGRFYHAPAAKHWNGQRYVPADDVSDWDFVVDDETKSRIETAVGRTVQRFERASMEQIKRYQHREHIPNEFVRAYSDLRSQLKRVDLDEQYTLGDFTPTEKPTVEFVEASLDAMAETYPREDYPEAYHLFAEWEETVRLLLDDDPDYATVEAFLDSFVTMLAKVELRFHHRQHIPDERIMAWEDERLEVKDEFAGQLADKRRELLASSRSFNLTGTGNGSDGARRRLVGSHVRNESR
ncbi:hypothetical protein [Halorussus halophilus]|uniref:hypothetical protein n=1 Tax=Halorussus halophilus TaxID=2650975 RepID=UPI001301049D|nr:hypothetical protein [Halorussus halophilus]